MHDEDDTAVCVDGPAIMRERGADTARYFLRHEAYLGADEALVHGSA